MECIANHGQVKVPGHGQTNQTWPLAPPAMRSAARWRASAAGWAGRCRLTGTTGMWTAAAKKCDMSLTSTLMTPKQVGWEGVWGGGLVRVIGLGRALVEEGWGGGWGRGELGRGGACMRK